MNNQLAVIDLGMDGGPFEMDFGGSIVIKGAVGGMHKIRGDARTIVIDVVPNELKDEVIPFMIDRSSIEDEAPKLQLNILPGVLIGMVVIFFLITVATCFGADVKDFGAVGDGIADESKAIQAAADDCKSRLRAVQPGGGSWMGSCPELFFPAGKYKITKPITLNPYQKIRGEDSILIQSEDCDSLVFEGCYQNAVSGMQFISGKRQIRFSNVNVDQTKLTIRDCNFQAWSDVAVSAEGTASDLHLSATLTIQNTNFDGGPILLTRCDSTTLTDCRHQFRGPMVVDGMASIVNKWKDGVLRLNGFTGTPALEAREARVHWVENWGSVVADASRFGGELGGIPIIEEHGGPNLKNPWKGRKLVITNSQMSCGKDAWTASAAITLRGVPQFVQVCGNDSLVSLSIPVFRVPDDYDLKAAVDSIGLSAKTSLSMYSYLIRPNQFYVAQPVPSPLLPFVK